MNGDEQGPNLNSFDPAWMRDGSGFGEDFQTEEELGSWDLYSGTNETQNRTDFWSTKVTSEQNQSNDVDGGGDCLANAGPPPDMGTYVLGSVDGTCQWIDTTTCP